MTETPISDLFRIPRRYFRSVQLEGDFHDLEALDHYVVTPSMAVAFSRVREGLKPESGRRAWRITGDYGVGKSSFALALAHLAGSGADRIAQLLGWTSGEQRPTLWPVLLTGSRSAIIPAIASAVYTVAEQRRPSRGKVSRALAQLMAEAQSLLQGGSLPAIIALIENLIALAADEDAGVLLIVDELGKFLEHAAMNPDAEDVFVLQRLAELAARSGQRPFVVVGLLHQGFQAYAERLAPSARHEWEKVAGRYEEIVFDQPLAHTAALVAGALNPDTSRLDQSVRDAAIQTAAATASTGWLGGATTAAGSLDTLKLYPLHPALLPVLVRFFSRFGQHERSLFGFLLSSEPFGLQAFADRAATASNWYGLPEFYDYIRAVFGHRLAGASYRSQWLRIVETIDAATELSPDELRVLKSIGLLNLLDAEDLLPTQYAIEGALSPAPSAAIATAVTRLSEQNLIFRRGLAGGFRLWPNSSVNLNVAFEAAGRAIGPLTSVSTAVERYLTDDPVMARRHYVERGTLRYFGVRYTQASSMLAAAAKPFEGDGLVLVVLTDTPQEAREATVLAASAELASRQEILVGVVPPLAGLAPETHDLLCWQWVADNTPELAEDQFVAAEVSRQLAVSRRIIAERLGELVGIRSGERSTASWLVGGVLAKPSKGGVSGLVSTICDQVYASAPQIANELLNRNTLSSAAAAARMKLIAGLFADGDKPLMGMPPDRSPPEKSMYLSVLKRGRVHRQIGDGYVVVEPDENDPLKLGPSIKALISEIVGARGDRVAVQALFNKLKQPPYGVRDGVAPLLLAILLRTRSHELAVYENGTFLHRFGATDFLRLTKAPGQFQLQHCRVVGVRLEVFQELVQTFAGNLPSRRPELLDVVVPLCRFAAQLPEYTRRANHLTASAKGVRDVLLSSTEPATMLFKQLPRACDVAPFDPDEASDRDRVNDFVARLRDAVDELRGAYSELIIRITDRVGAAMGETDGLDRARLASRAARVVLAAREPRLRAFANRLRDPSLSDEAWVEALSSFIVSKPPAKWLPVDEARFNEEIGTICDFFFRVEAAAFNGDETLPSGTVRLNLTRADGMDVVRIVPRTLDTSLSEHANLVAARLPKAKSERLEVLTRLLWDELEVDDEGQMSDNVAPSSSTREKLK